MAPSLLVRTGERRDTIAAFAFLFVFVGSHTILETARDALFLSKVPGSRLPWVYLAIAGFSLLSNKLQGMLRRFQGRASVSIWALAAGLGTVAIWALLPRFGHAGLYVLYIWSGVIVSLVLTQLWSYLGDLFSVTQAKRLYGVISVGSMAGAVAGGALVSSLALRASPATFSLFAALGFLLASGLPAFLSKGGGAGASDAAPAEGEEASLQENASFVVRRPYVRRVVLISILITVSVTVADYVFKSTVSAVVPPADLARVFGTAYLAFNVLSFAVQLLGTNMLIRRLPLPYVLAIMPIGLALGGVGFAVASSVGTVLALKGIDGSMRNSVNRTASELLLAPLTDSARRVAKRFTDVVGQRGGQVIASLSILALSEWARGGRWLAGLLVIASSVAALLAFSLKPLYVDLFRRTILQGKKSDAYPALDVSSLETLLTALDSDSDEEVLAALRILEHENKVHLVPGLILYHPEEEVVISALRLFAQTGRKVALHAIGHLDAHPSQRIRAEAIAARAVLDPDAEHLAERLENEQSPEARAAIYATMASFGMLEEVEAREALNAIAAGDSATSKVVIAEVIAWRAATRFEDVLITLTHASEPEVRRAAIAAVGTLHGPLGGDALVELLADPRTTADARAALIAMGEPGSRALERALRDRARLRSVRRQVPSALAAADPERAIGVLLDHLHDEGDGMVRYRSILALQAIVDSNPDHVIDPKQLDQEIAVTVSRAYRYIDRIVTLERGTRRVPERATPGQRLLVDLLRDKERNAVGRLFRLLALAFPRQDFGAIYRSIESGRKGYKANAVELIQNLLREPLRSAVVGLVDDVEDEQRLGQAQSFHTPLGASYEEVIARTLESSSQVVRDLAVYHIGELSLTSLLPRIEELARSERTSADVERTRGLLLRASSRASSSEGLGALEEATQAR